MHAMIDVDDLIVIWVNGCNPGAGVIGFKKA